jgi:hypothetical protein
MRQRARGCGPERLRAGELEHAELLPLTRPPRGTGNAMLHSSNGF